MISRTDNTIFQEIIFGSYASLEMTDFRGEQIVEVESHLQTVFYAEWQVDCTSQS